MGISDIQYREIMHYYDQVRMKNHQVIEDRINLLYDKIPALKEVQDEIVALSIAEARRELFATAQTFDNAETSGHPVADTDHLAIYRNKLQELSDRKVQLLVEHNYPADYLSPIYECKDCQDTGYVKDGNQTKPCHCLRIKKAHFLYRDSHLEFILQEENFDCFDSNYYSDDPNAVDDNLSLTPRQNIEKLRDICVDYIRHFDDATDNLIFYGTPGVGKSFLTHCIAKELLDTEHSVIYLTSIELFDILGKHTFHKDSEMLSDASAKVESLLWCDLLIIDDLGTELTNSFTISQMYYFIENRRVNGRSTIFSTNLSFMDIKDRYGDRIFSRFTAYYQFLKVIGDDIRSLKLFR